MHAGIYKAGQGYWTRVVSAVFCGTLALAAAAWAFGQAAAIPLPAKAYAYTVAAARGEPAQSVTLVVPTVSEDETTGRIEDQTEDLGQAQVVSFAGGASGSSGTLTVQAPAGASREKLLSVSQIRAETFNAEVRTRRAIPVIARAYLQTGVASAVILIGVGAIYWFIAAKPGSVDFLIATDGEMKKVNWSTRREIIGSTQVVIVAAFLIAAVLFGIDSVFRAIFSWIDVLQFG